eukprot:TRINITY_DN2779_c0_g2_i2.p1 TRINITY_DN2779_c0_g2~~TRINITY_DN2779_c0_g2_i2.p1  ORF type:complete len:266 (+),score=56.42 TRINITY_DN2779_c0_g2_i2:395-1192(+)
MEQAISDQKHSDKDRSHMLSNALEAFSEALVIQADLPEAYYRCGLALKEKARLQEANVNSMLSNIGKIESWLGSAERVMQTAIALTESSQIKVEENLYSSLAEIFQLQAELNFEDSTAEEKYYSKAVTYYYLALEDNPWDKNLRKAVSECRTKVKQPCTIKTGYLIKQGAINKNWKRRYFVLQEEQLLYYPTEKSTAPKGRIFLNDVSENSFSDKFLAANRFCLAMTCSKRCYYLTSDDKETIVGWQRSVQAALSVLQYEKEQGK